MSRKLLGHNGGGRATYWHEHGDGSWAIEQVQADLTQFLDANKVYQNHGDGMKWGDDYGDLNLDVRMVARIPWIVIDDWRVKYGIDYFDPDPEVQKRIDRLLDSNEYKWLRTTTGRLE